MKPAEFFSIALMIFALTRGVAPVAVQAQNPKQPQAPRTNFDCTGTVKAVDAGMFQLAADDGEQWLVKVTRSEITIDAAGTPVRAQLADKASVSLDLADLSYVRPGDKVEFSGWHITGAKGRAWATKIAVTAAEPLSDGGAKKGKAAL